MVRVIADVRAQASVHWPNIEAVILLHKLYLMTALPVVLAAIAMLWYLKRFPLLWFEYITWLTPGITYWFLWDVMRWEFRFPGKTMGNLIEPFFLGLIVGVFFVARVLFGLKRPAQQITAAALFLGLSNAAAVAIQVMTPGIPLRESELRMSPNNAMDSDTYSAPLRAPISARHRER
jgi:hypothetical protein